MSTREAQTAVAVATNRSSLKDALASHDPTFCRLVIGTVDFYGGAFGRICGTNLVGGGANVGSAGRAFNAFGAARCCPTRRIVSGCSARNPVWGAKASAYLMQ